MSLCYKCERCGAIYEKCHILPEANATEDSYKIHKHVKGWYDMGTIDLCTACSNDLDHIVDDFMHADVNRDLEQRSFQEDMMFVLNDMTKAQAKFAIKYLKKRMHGKIKEEK